MLRPSRPSRRSWLLAALGLVLLLGAPVRAADTEKLVVNVNTASFEELQALPGIGESRARAILAAREERGGFRSVDELLEVKGIGPTNLERLRPHATVSGPTRLPESR